MATGLVVDNISPSLSINFDKFMTVTTAPRVLVARFGDGYEQRLADGINTIEEQYEVSFLNRPKAEIDDLIVYFDAKGGVTSFNFTIPDTNASPQEKVVKVVCANYTRVYVNTNCYSCTATFRRVYEI